MISECIVKVKTVRMPETYEDRNPAIVVTVVISTGIPMLYDYRSLVSPYGFFAPTSELNINVIKAIYNISHIRHCIIQP